MTKRDKLIKRFLSIPKDLTWDELVVFLSIFGFESEKTGITGGSRRRFKNKNGVPITLHEPHNPGIVKPCYIKQVIEILEGENLL